MDDLQTPLPRQNELPNEIDYPRLEYLETSNEPFWMAAFQNLECSHFKCGLLLDVNRREYRICVFYRFAEEQVDYFT